MKQFINIIDLFDLEFSDLSSRDTIMDKKEEFLLSFDLGQESSIVLKGYEMDRNEIIKLFDDLTANISNYAVIHKKKSLSAFLVNGNLEALDLNEFTALENGLKDWLKPFFNQAFYRSALHIIQRESYINPKQYKGIIKKVNSVNNEIDPAYLDESKQKIDESWGDLLKDARVLFIDQPPGNKVGFLKAFQQIKHLSSPRKAKLVHAYARPIGFGKTIFDNFLKTLLNAYLNSVSGNVSAHSYRSLIQLKSICLYLKKEDPTQKKNYNEILEVIYFSESKKQKNDVLKAVFMIILGLFFLNLIGNYVVNHSIWDKIFPSDQYALSVDTYNPDSNTVELSYNFRDLRGWDISGDQLLEKGWDAFEPYLPDTHQFKIKAEVNYIGGDVVIERRIHITDSTHYILPTIEDSIYFAQPISINYEFEEGEGLAFGCNYLLARIPGRTKINGMMIKTYYDSIVQENCFITNKSILLEPEKHFDGHSKQRTVVLGSINDYFFLKNRVFNYDEVQKVPRTHESRFFKNSSDITLEIENGMSPDHFFILASSEKKILAKYLIDKETKEVLRVSKRRRPSLDRLESGLVQKVHRDEHQVQQFLNP